MLVYDNSTSVNIDKAWAWWVKKESDNIIFIYFHAAHQTGNTYGLKFFYSSKEEAEEDMMEMAKAFDEHKITHLLRRTKEYRRYVERKLSSCQSP